MPYFRFEYVGQQIIHFTRQIEIRAIVGDFKAIRQINGKKHISITRVYIAL